MSISRDLSTENMSQFLRFYDLIQQTSLFTVDECPLRWMSALMNIRLDECPPHHCYTPIGMIYDHKVFSDWQHNLTIINPTSGRKNHSLAKILNYVCTLNIVMFVNCTSGSNIDDSNNVNRTGHMYDSKTSC